MFERAAQVNARFTPGSCQPQEVVAALEEIGLARRQITVLSRSAAPPAPPPSGFAQRLMGRFKSAPPAPAAADPDWQIIVHMGQEAALGEAAQAVFRRFGAASIENFAASHSPNRAFGPGTGPKEGDPE
jgi:hypothetical protein